MLYGFKGFKYKQVSGPRSLLKLGIVWERHLLDPSAKPGHGNWGGTPAAMLPGGKRSCMDFTSFSPNLISFTVLWEPKREIGG